MTTSDLTRRTVLGALGGGAAATVLAGCSDGTTSGSSSEGSPSTSESPGGGSSEGTSPMGESPGGGSSTGAGGTALVAAADVPVGSGVILKDPQVVVTQPTKGNFLAFSAICSHQRCPVGTITGDQILCPCHGSVFSTADGSVIQGPAEAPLSAVEVSVKGDQVVQA